MYSDFFKFTCISSDGHLPAYRKTRFHYVNECIFLTKNVIGVYNTKSS